MALQPLPATQIPLFPSIHPRIEAIKLLLSPPSPALIPSDLLQPSSGRLERPIQSDLTRLAAKRSYQEKSVAILKFKKLGNETLSPISGKFSSKLDISASKLCRKRRKTREEGVNLV